jgi:hypothetical protein
MSQPFSPSRRRTGRHAVLVVLALPLLSPLLAVGGARAAAPATHPTTVVEGWYPAERMCEMDVRDVSAGQPWSCLRSADRSGWELRVETRR